MQWGGVGWGGVLAMLSMSIVFAVLPALAVSTAFAISTVFTMSTMSPVLTVSTASSCDNGGPDRAKRITNPVNGAMSTRPRTPWKLLRNALPLPHPPSAATSWCPPLAKCPPRAATPVSSLSGHFDPPARRGAGKYQNGHTPQEEGRPQGLPLTTRHPWR